MSGDKTGGNRDLGTLSYAARGDDALSPATSAGAPRFLGLTHGVQGWLGTERAAAAVTRARDMHNRLAQEHNLSVAEAERVKRTDATFAGVQVQDVHLVWTPPSAPYDLACRQRPDHYCFETLISKMGEDIARAGMALERAAVKNGKMQLRADMRAAVFSVALLDLFLDSSTPHSITVYVMTEEEHTCISRVAKSVHEGITVRTSSWRVSLEEIDRWARSQKDMSEGIARWIHQMLMSAMLSSSTPDYYKLSRGYEPPTTDALPMPTEPDPVATPGGTGTTGGGGAGP
jgi:hypothetical protein